MFGQTITLKLLKEQIMDFIESLASVTPIYHDPFYKDSFKEVLYYSTEAIYDEPHRPCLYKLVNHKDYWVDNKFKEPTDLLRHDRDYCAFAIMMNIFHTKIIPIDIDNPGTKSLSNTLTGLFEDERVIAVDAIESTPKTSKGHIMVGLKEECNIRHILPLIPNICNGFVACCLRRREAVLRVSEKFHGAHIRRSAVYTSTEPQYAMCARKHNGNIYISRNFNIPTGPSEETETKQRVNLRS